MSQQKSVSTDAFKSMLLEATLSTFTSALKRFRECAENGKEPEFKPLGVPVKLEDTHIWIAGAEQLPRYYLVVNNQPYERLVIRNREETLTADLVWEDIAEIDGIDLSGNSQVAAVFILQMLQKFAAEYNVGLDKLEIMVQIPAGFTVPVPFLWKENEKGEFEMVKQLVWGSDIFTDEGVAAIMSEN